MKGKFEKIKTVLPTGADGILITSPVNQFYACAFPFTDGYVLVTHDKTYLVCDFRYIEAAQASEGVEKVELKAGVLGELLSSLNVKTLLFEDRFATVADLRSFQEDYEGVEFVPCGALLDDLREFKDPDELDKIKKAQSIADDAFDYILSFINPERTEIEVALELEYYMRRHGADGIAFETIAVSGQSSSLPHGVPKNVKLHPGFLTMDYGCKFGGYCSDMTRTVVLGKADDEMKKVYQTVQAAQRAALDYVDFGVDCAELDGLARDIIDREYKGAFGHGLGHGVGLYIHEAPKVNRRGEGTKLRAGHVITIEPGIYLAGKYGVRIEDMVLFYPEHLEKITRAPKELIEI